MCGHEPATAINAHAFFRQYYHAGMMPSVSTAFAHRSVGRAPAFFLGMARQAQRLQVANLVAAALTLGHDVVNMGRLARHHSPAYLALVVVPH
jgi:hypothetical protein